MIDVSIIIVNYKTSNMVADAISSVIEKTSPCIEFEFIIVDNSESIDELQKLQNIKYKNIHIIDSGGNIGFGRANNLGSKNSLGKYLLFLNSDTLLINDAIVEMFNFLEKNLNVAAVGPNIYNKSLEPSHSFFKKEKNLKNERKELSFCSYVYKKITKKRSDFNYTNEPLLIEGYLCGACFLIRKSIFDSIGGFDDRIFMYAEDSLIFYKIINLTKYDVYNIPFSKLIHFEGGSDTIISEKKAKNIIDGNFVYYSEIESLEYAIKYLKFLKKKAMFKLFYSRLFRIKSKILTNKYLINAINDKLLNITNGV